MKFSIVPVLSALSAVVMVNNLDALAKSGDVCRKTRLGLEYMGTISRTVSGYTCQRWDVSEPHEPHDDMKNDENYLDGSRTLAKNFCRNPDKDSGGPWCYTTDPNKRWEYCNIPYCQKPSQSVSVYKGQCDPPFTAVNGSHCYFPSYDQLVTTFKNAQLVCSWLHPNGKLAEFETLQELGEVTSFLSRTTSTYHWAAPGPWIGAVEKDNTNEFVWLSNEPIEEGNWAEPSYVLQTSGDAVALDASNDFQWIQVDSQKTLPILCEIPSNPPPVVLKCPYKFFRLGEICYRAVTDLKFTWWEAQRYCKSVATGGKLAELKTSEEIALVTTHLAMNNYPCPNDRYWGYWFGAEDRDHSYNFRWASNGKVVLFYNWARNQPDDDKGVAIFLACNENWQWHDSPHGWEIYALCEAPLIKA